MRRDAQAVLLVTLAAGLAKLSLTGVATRYVGAGMVPLLVVAALLMAGLGGYTLWRSLQEAHRQRRTPAVDPAGAGRPGWLLLVPIAVALVVVPPPLGADQASRYGTVLARHAPAEFGPLAEGEPVRLNLVDYAARAVVERGRSLSGRRVSLTGFVVGGVDGRPYLARLVVSCCAADARPVKIGLAGSLPAGLRHGDWIEVEGGYTDRVDRDPLTGDLIPYLEVSDLRSIDAPAQPYETA